MNQKLFNMISLSTSLLILISCTNLNADKKVVSNEKETTVKHEQTVSYPIELKLDTNSQFQNKLIEPEDSLYFGNNKYLIHVGEGSDIGYILFKDQNKFYVSLIEWDNCFKVIGITEITGLNKDEEYIELLYSDSPITSIIFGIIKKTDTNIKTIKAWQINNSKKLLEEINPLTVDFTETYNTEI